MARPGVSPVHRDDARWAWVFVGPCLFGLLVFTYLPTLASVGLSFSYWDLLGSPRWVGLQNYGDVLSDSLFWQAATNTAGFVVASAVLEIGSGLLIAVLLNRAIPAQSFLRTAYFLPYVTPLVGVAVVWGWIYDPAVGLLNWLAGAAGLLALLNEGQPLAWLQDARTAMGAIVVLRLWKNVGYTVILFLAGLQAVPTSVMESATLDGAGPVQTFFRVTLPMISPTLFFVLMMTLINAFQAFDSIYVLTQGGPAHATEVLVYWMFKNAFEFYRIGPASAIAYLVFAIILVLTGLQWQLRKRWVLHED